MKARGEYVHVSDLGGGAQMIARARMPVGLPMWARPAAATILMGIDEDGHPCRVNLARDGWLEAESNELITVCASWATASAR